MIGIVLAVALLAQQSETVAITLSKDSPAIILTRKEAEAQFRQLCAGGTDDRRLAAIARALNPTPDWPQMVMSGDASVCNRNPKPIVPVPLEKQR
jgi:hypothetical protein